MKAWGLVLDKSGVRVEFSKVQTRRRPSDVHRNAPPSLPVMIIVVSQAYFDGLRLHLNSIVSYEP